MPPTVRIVEGDLLDQKVDMIVTIRKRIRERKNDVTVLFSFGVR